MMFFDAHCDAVMNAYDGPFDFVNGESRGHMDLPRLRAAGHRAQVFAVFAVASYYPDRDRTAMALAAFATLRGWADASGGRMKIVQTRADVAAAFADDAAPLAAILGLEGADPLPDAAALEQFFALGLRLVIPAWDDNIFSGSSTGGGGPLTAEGRGLIDLARSLGVMVDVSHLSDAAFDEVAVLLADRPFIASHSNCRALSPAARNLTDHQIRVLADRGGVMGINLAADFLDPVYLERWDEVMKPVRALPIAERQKVRMSAGKLLDAIPRPERAWIARHVQHAMNLGGEECVGLGGDLDGMTYMPEGLTGVESYGLIEQALRDAGLTERQVEKVCWRNMARVFGEVLS
jgi:membrane dipeptidase